MLGGGQPRGEAVDPVPVEGSGVEEAWLAGVSQGARQEGLVPTTVRIFVVGHGVGVGWLPEIDDVDSVPGVLSASTHHEGGIHGCGREEDGRRESHRYQHSTGTLLIDKRHGGSDMGKLSTDPYV
jgi:hypothetical protein